MRLLEILQKENNLNLTLKESETVLSAVKKMLEHKASGLLVVTPGGDPSGIFTEKDVLKLVAERHTQLDKIEIWEVMSKKIISVEVNMTTEDAISFMSEKHIHHLPVLKDNKLAGFISMDDLIEARLKKLKHEASFLKDYITGG